MAFSLRRMLSNIYFSKSDEETGDKEVSAYMTNERSVELEFERTEPDSTCRYASSLKLPDSVKKFSARKGSFSDTDILGQPEEKKEKRRKKLKLDIKKASQSSDSVDHDCSNVENTPKHVLLENDLFCERFNKFDFNRSFDIFDAMSETSEEEIDIKSLSESDTEATSSSSEKEEIKMCRKVESAGSNLFLPSATPESFGDVELDKNEEERITLLLNYQMKLEKVDVIIKKLLSDFKYYIEVSKIFNRKSIVTALPGTDMSHIPKILGGLKFMDSTRNISPVGSWNIIVEKEDETAKNKLKSQLISIRQEIDSFINTHFQNQGHKAKKTLSNSNKSLTFDLHKGERQHKQLRLTEKKKIKHYDFPDLREAMLCLFYPEYTETSSKLNETDVKCCCQCHNSSIEADPGLTTKTDTSDMSVTSSIGNFTLDSTSLSAYSESLDQIISYNSFDDSSLYSSLLQKTAIERITFYVQVHGIRLNTELNDSKNRITFYCPSCKLTEHDESCLINHILSQSHCEKIHFLYKTAYIKKCVADGSEIQPSSVLNPMKWYRDDNKIVCFGDTKYACTLCFENLMVGESILMAHCSSLEHVSRKDKLDEIFE